MMSRLVDGGRQGVDAIPRRGELLYLRGNCCVAATLQTQNMVLDVDVLSALMLSVVVLLLLLSSVDQM
jgi:hypothetical protein